MTIIIAGTITINEENHEVILEAALEMMSATHQEKGCIEYVFSADPQDRGILRLYEKWESADDLKPHVASSHMAVWNQKGKELGVTGRDIALYEVSSETSI